MLKAEWAEFDYDNARWDVPKERMKMKKPHIVPLARQTLEVLGLLRSLSGDSRWVFPGSGPKNPTISDGTILMALKRMGSYFPRSMLKSLASSKSRQSWLQRDPRNST
jgi:integrase